MFHTLNSNSTKHTKCGPESHTALNALSNTTGEQNAMQLQVSTDLEL
jgi:hypothetical protein